MQINHFFAKYICSHDIIDIPSFPQSLSISIQEYGIPSEKQKGGDETPLAIKQLQAFMVHEIMQVGKLK